MVCFEDLNDCCDHIKQLLWISMYEHSLKDKKKTSENYKNIFHCYSFVFIFYIKKFVQMFMNSR